MPKIRLAEVNRIGTELTAEASSSRSALQTVQGEIEDLCSLSAIQGATAVSIKNYFSEVHLPILKALSEISESLPQTYKKMLSQFKSHVDASPDTVIRSEHLGELHKDIDRLKDHFDTIHRQLAADVRSVSDVASFRVPSADGLTHDVTQQEKAITQLKTHFETFASVNYAGELMPLLNTLEQAMTKIKTSYNPHFGQTNFYQAGSFAKTELGKRLKVKTAQLEKTRQIEKAKKEGTSGNNIKFVKKGLGYVSIGVKVVPPAFARMKGLKITREKGSNYLIIKGRTNVLSRYLDRAGKTLDNNPYLLGARRIRAFGSKGIDKGTEKLVKELPDLKYYVLSNSGSNTLSKIKGKLQVTRMAAKSSLNSWWDFAKPASWRKLGYVGKAGKALGVAGSALTVASDFGTNWDAKTGQENWGNFAGDASVDVGSAAAAAGAGALAGSFFLPPLGTIVGAGVGFGISYALSKKSKQFGGKSITDYAKQGMHNLIHTCFP